jgi:hypothetical protein
MIPRNNPLLKEFEEGLDRTPANYLENLRVFLLLLEEARSLGALPPKHPLEDIELDIRYARAINSVGTP